jgi:hypothetical protein
LTATVDEPEYPERIVSNNSHFIFASCHLKPMPLVMPKRAPAEADAQRMLGPSAPCVRDCF